jgi:GNAT superfamily N-acetyltransferase
MQIRPVDVHDHAAFRSFYETTRAYALVERPEAPFWSESEAAVRLRRDGVRERTEPFVALDGDQVVGAGFVELPLLDNLDKAYAAFGVVPCRRREGIGTVIAEHAAERARAGGRSWLIVDSHYPLGAGEDHPHRRFAAALGFSLGNAELGRVLDLPVPDDRIEEWIDEAARSHSGYQIHTFVDDVPGHLLQSYLPLVNQLAVDAPTGEIDFEETGDTVETYLRSCAVLREQGRTRYISVATVPRAEGQEAVAHSVLTVPVDGADMPNVYQWATFVAREHRGHALGLAVKARNLRAVQKAHPERTRVHTSNSEMNGPMVAINERLGFRPVEVNAEFQRRL